MANKAIGPTLDEDFSDLSPRLREVARHSAEWIDDQHSAQIVSDHCFEISPRTMPTWNLPTRDINGRAMHRTADVLREAQRRIDQAPERVRAQRPAAAVGVGRGRNRRRTLTGEFERTLPLP